MDDSLIPLYCNVMEASQSKWKDSHASWGLFRKNTCPTADPFHLMKSESLNRNIGSISLQFKPRGSDWCFLSQRASLNPLTIILNRNKPQCDCDIGVRKTGQVRWCSFGESVIQSSDSRSQSLIFINTTALYSISKACMVATRSNFCFCFRFLCELLPIHAVVTLQWEPIIHS